MKLFLLLVIVSVAAHHSKRAKCHHHHKRDLGIGVLVTGAVVNGIIGSTISNMMTLAEPPKGPTPGGCEWFGTFGLCRGICPPSYDFIEEASSSSDPYFGKPCVWKFHKKKCCRPADGDCSWSGSWQSAKDMLIYQCTFEPFFNANVNASRPHMGEHGPQVAVETNRCGFFSCTNKDNTYDLSRRKIVHKSPGLCNMFKFEETNDKNETRSIEARAICGLIAFYHGDVHQETWFKM